MNERELLNIKSKIDQAKSSVSELQGRHKYLLDTLKKEWSLETLIDVRSHIASMRSDLDDLDRTIAIKTAEVEEAYDKCS